METKRIILISILIIAIIITGLFIVINLYNGYKKISTNKIIANENTLSDINLNNNVDNPAGEAEPPSTGGGSGSSSNTGTANNQERNTQSSTNNSSGSGSSSSAGTVDNPAGEAEPPSDTTSGSSADIGEVDNPAGEAEPPQ